MGREEQIKIYWDRRKNCEQAKHKLKDNDFGVTWCVTCGYLSNKPAPEGIIKNQNRLQKEVEYLIELNKTQYSLKDVMKVVNRLAFLSKDEILKILEKK